MNWFKRRIFFDYAGGKDNPSGIHEEGRLAHKKLEETRLRIARILKCQARDIIFTSGGTESDNLAVLGVFEEAKEKFEKPHIIIGTHEHPAVYESAKEAQRQGAELTITDEPMKHLKENTVLVSIIYANNETGAINPVPKIARLVRDYRKKHGSRYPLMHTDATSAYEYLEVDINKVPADLISIENVLTVRPPATIRPRNLGGGQERRLRAGTQNLKVIEDFARNLEVSVKNREKESERLTEIKNFFIDEIRRSFPKAVINTPRISLPHIVSVSFPGQLHEFLAIKLDFHGIAVSTGSACDSSKDEESKEALRFSFGKETSKIEIKETISVLKKIML
ncbi:aminotransferase class V-fold PLP-dependent enzyme [Candidatus Parcubacteria bacterium]|nr:aminotransferase class V-fold PLP-dependent enzyme [Candidatus Parcubacteria bacterium]